MRKIDIDDEIYAYLQSQAIPFEELSPNTTLRRLLNLNSKSLLSDETKQQIKPDNKKHKQLKTNLLLLIRSGILKEGQKLFLYDYSGNIINGYDATISGKMLLKHGERFSMSKLAEIGLKENKLMSDSVQGPARWFTEDGISVFKLWSNYLKKGD
ncbi:MAG: hypothetical protein ABR886_09120 [Dehalococcoidales bacterium]|jgi:hypothetical protein